MSKLTWFTDSTELAKMGKANPINVVSPIYRGPFALVADPTDDTRSDLSLANLRCYKVTVGEDVYTAMLLCRLNSAGAPEWAMYCGDSQLSGKHTVDGKNLAAALRADGRYHVSLFNSLELSGWVGKAPDQSACNFFGQLARTRKFCSHTQSVVAELVDSDYEEMGEELKKWSSGEEASALATVAEAALSEADQAVLDAAFVEHVLMVGDRGAGKTYLARSLADRFDAVYLEMQMHPSMEPWEFRAHDRVFNGKVYTVLGRLAEAVYWIQKGKRVVLVMDEFLNMNPAYSTVINTPLTLTANDTYLVDTGRILPGADDGIGIQEMVEVPADMLWIVATTNIGADYGVDKVTPSVLARFKVIMMNTDIEKIRKIVTNRLAEYSMPAEFADKFVKFTEAVNELVENKELDQLVTVRMLNNVMRAIHKRNLRDKKSISTAKGWKAAISKELESQATQVVTFENGYLDEEQLKIYMATVKASFA